MFRRGENRNLGTVGILDEVDTVNVVAISLSDDGDAPALLGACCLARTHNRTVAIRLPGRSVVPIRRCYPRDQYLASLKDNQVAS